MIFRKAQVRTKTPLPDEPAVYLCNHSAAIGPALMTLYFPVPHKTWMISYAFDRTVDVNYFAHDAFFIRAHKHKKFYRAISRFSIRTLQHLFPLADPIPVYHDRRVIDTFRDSENALESGKSLVIFPESPVRFSPYVHELYDGFADVGRAYYKATGKKLKFYPVYAEKKNRVISVGAPIEYDPDVPAKQERQAIASYVRDAIDALARELPEHKPTPFLPPVWYEYYGEYEHDVAGYWRMMEENGD